MVSGAGALGEAFWCPLEDTPEEGGHGARLMGRLSGSGLPVLPGFVVLPKAYEEYLLAGEITGEGQGALALALEHLHTRAAACLPDGGAALCRNGLILTVSIPAPVHDILSPLWSIGAGESGTGAVVLETLCQFLKQEAPAPPVGDVPLVTHLSQALLLIYAWWESEVMTGLRQVQHLPRNLPISVMVQAAPWVPEDDGLSALNLTSRHPFTGEARLHGMVYAGAVGDDPMYHRGEGTAWDQATCLKGPQRAEVADLCRRVETYLKEMVQVSFSGKGDALWLTAEEAVLKVRPTDLEQAIRSRLTNAMKSHQLARGKPMAGGWMRGALSFDPEDVPRLRQQTNGPVVMCVERLGHMRREMLFGVDAILAIETAIPPQVQSACLARQIPCLVGLDPAFLQGKANLNVSGKVLGRGDMVMLDADSGVLYDGKIAPATTALPQEIQTLLDLTEQFDGPKVLANVTTPQDAALARSLGAQGIGLLRTEHLFRTDQRKDVMVHLIMARTAAKRREALEDLLPIQRNDFKHLFREMAGLPTTVRLLDPPLYHYLPTYEDLLREMNEARLKGDFSLPEEKETLLRKLFELREQNPMLGLRGCRLGILYPEIYEIQVRAVYEAVMDLKEEGIDTRPEILVPFVDHVNEVKALVHLLERSAKEVLKRRGGDLPFQLGIMIETPRAAMVADQLAQYVDFFSIGSNDLTQTTYGLCREDAEGRFLFTYLDRGIYERNPFEALDRDGVGRLIRIALEDGRAANPQLRVGLSGAQAAEPGTVAFAYEAGIDYLSCPVASVPVAKLLVAQTVLRHTQRRSDLTQGGTTP